MSMLQSQISFQLSLYTTTGEDGCHAEGRSICRPLQRNILMESNRGSVVVLLIVTRSQDASGFKLVDGPLKVEAGKLFPLVAWKVVTTDASLTGW